MSATGGTAPYFGVGTYTEQSGTYTYTVTDSNGCTSSTTITLNEPNALQVTAAINSQIPCNGGTGVIDITASGGIAPYTGVGLFSVNAGTHIHCY